MAIEFQPKNMGLLLTQAETAKRFRNREGFVISYNENGEATQFALEGPILELYEAAKVYDQLFPSHRIVVQMNGCGYTGMPDLLATNRTLETIV